MDVLGFQLKYFVLSQMFSELFRNVMLWIEVVAVCSSKFFAIIFCNLSIRYLKILLKKVVCTLGSCSFAEMWYFLNCNRIFKVKEFVSAKCNLQNHVIVCNVILSTWIFIGKINYSNAFLGKLLTLKIIIKTIGFAASLII